MGGKGKKGYFLSDVVFLLNHQTRNIDNFKNVFFKSKYINKYRNMS